MLWLQHVILDSLFSFIPLSQVMGCVRKVLNQQNQRSVHVECVVEVTEFCMQMNNSK